MLFFFTFVQRIIRIGLLDNKIKNQLTKIPEKVSLCQTQQLRYSAQASNQLGEYSNRPTQDQWLDKKSVHVLPNQYLGGKSVSNISAEKVTYKRVFRSGLWEDHRDMFEE